MKMIRFFIFIAFVVNTNASYSQTTIRDTIIPTTKVISRLSYYWQLDSLAGNGFRLYSVNEITKSRLDNVSEDFLLYKLGKPNQLRNTNHGREYVYYYFDIKAMPKGYDAPSACAYVAFRFKTNEKYASEIFEGDIDR